MVRITIDISPELSRQIERIVRDGWFISEDAVVRTAVEQFVEGKSFLGDSPRMLHRFAADALNESKPETALKFVDRALSLLEATHLGDLSLYQQLVELRVQTLLIVGRDREAMTSLEEAHEKLPNNPSINRWIERVRARGA